MNTVPSYERPFRFKVVMYLLVAALVLRLLLSFKSIKWLTPDPDDEAHVKAAEEKVYQVLRAFLAIIGFVLPASALASVFFRDSFIAILLGLLFTLYLVFDVSIALTFNEGLLQIQYAVDLSIIFLLFYFAKLLKKIPGDNLCCFER